MPEGNNPYQSGRLRANSRTRGRAHNADSSLFMMKRRSLGQFAAIVLTAMIMSPAGAAGDNLLIQIQHDGRYQVWHSEGVTTISEEDALAVAATARPEGGEPQAIAGGRARGLQTEHGVVIEMIDAAHDSRLLFDRDACGAVRIWHSEGESRLSEEQITELVMSALPGGGPRLTFNGRHAKAYITPLGYAVVLWTPVARQREP